ncbi:MAG: hypothetical protein AB7S80_07270 [Rhizobiaceae bacterium]
MGWTLISIEELPEPGDLVWCKFPLRETPGAPGPIARPTLVRATAILENPETGNLYGAVEVSYGTGTFVAAECPDDLLITSREAYQRMGLHKPTRIALDPANRKNLIWCEEYFVPQNYVRDSGVIAGRLGPDEIEQMRECLKRRGLLVVD